MKINWCKIFGHKWQPVFISGFYIVTEVKFVAAICEKCKLGEKELKAAIDKMTTCDTCSYSEKYFKA